NGAIGDFLHHQGNGLDVGMTLRHQGRPIALEREALAEAYPEATGHLCVLVHGLSATEWSWSVASEHFHGTPGVNIGTQLNADANYTPLFVRYNSGRHVSINGQQLSDLLTALVEAYPHPIETLALVGHSMGGLVSRSAAHHAHTHNAPWLDHLDHLVCIGSPHLGAPLEKVANALSAVLGMVNHPGTQVPAKVLNARSEGIKDLRFGYIQEAEWQGLDPDALLTNNAQGVTPIPGVRFMAIAGTLTQDPNHPAGALLGDLLVRTGSATHYSEATEDGTLRHVPFRAERIFPGTDHLRLANHPDVYAVVRDHLTQPPDPSA
ncbi:MAG: alpha/beta fold hydrolase, partial [Myxococcota bacterium]